MLIWAALPGLTVVRLKDKAADFSVSRSIFALWTESFVVYLSLLSENIPYLSELADRMIVTENGKIIF